MKDKSDCWLKNSRADNDRAARGKRERVERASIGHTHDVQIKTIPISKFEDIGLVISSSHGDCVNNKVTTNNMKPRSTSTFSPVMSEMTSQLGGSYDVNK